MEDKQKIYRSIIADGIAEVYSNVKNIHGFFPVNFDGVTEIKPTAKINLFFFVMDLPSQRDNSNSIGNYYGAIDSDVILRKYCLPCSMRAIIELSDLNKQPTLRINKTYYRMGKIRINDFCPPGIHLRDLLSASLISMGYIPIHSASFVSEKNGVMLVGTGGMGKTAILVHAIQHGYPYLADDMTIIDKECNIYPCAGISSIAYESEFKSTSNNSFKEKISRIFPPLGYIYQRPYLDIGLLAPQLELATKTKARKVFILSKGKPCIVKISKEQAFNLVLQINRIEFPYSGNQMLLSYSLLNQWLAIQNLMQKEEVAIKNLVSSTDCYLCTASNPDEYFTLIQSNI